MPTTPPDEDPDEYADRGIIDPLIGAAYGPQHPTDINEDIAPLPGLGEFEFKRGQPLHQQRFTLAIGLLILVALIAIGLLGAAIFVPTDHIEAVKSMGSVVFGPLVTLLGTSFAWYYASRKSD